jgi:CubicO group peptidase (beta-lactamase class C family)
MPNRLPAVFAAALILTACSGGGQRQTSGITSVLVMKHGRIVRESYYGGVEPSDRLPIFSITKSVTSRSSASRSDGAT